MSLKHKVEAILFSTGKKILVDEIAKLCRKPVDDIKAALEDLKLDYERKESSLQVVEEGLYWKLIVKEEHLPLVRNIVTSTELSKTMMETLAVIAWKSPVKQSEVIKLRTNKAYDHLRELEESGYITREKHGRTKLIRLTAKFFEYFDVPEDKLKEKFKDLDSMAQAIVDKELESKQIRAEQKKKAEEAGKKGKEIDIIDEQGTSHNLDVYTPKWPSEAAKPKVVIEEEKLGSLEIVDEAPEEEPDDKEQTEHGEEATFELVEEADSEEQKEGSAEPERLEEAPEEEPDKEEKSEEVKEEEPEPSDKTEEPTEDELAGEEPSGENEEDKEEGKSDVVVEKRVKEILNPAKEDPSVEVAKRFDEIVHPKKEELSEEDQISMQIEKLENPVEEPEHQEEESDSGSEEEQPKSGSKEEPQKQKEKPEED